MWVSEQYHRHRNLQNSGSWPSTLPNMPPTLSRPAAETAETLLGLPGSALAMLIGPAAPPALPPCRCCRASAPGMAPAVAPVELAAALKSFFLRRHTHQVSTVPCQAISSCSSQTCQECNPETFFSLPPSNSAPLTLPWSFHVITVSHVNMTHPCRCHVLLAQGMARKGKYTEPTVCARARTGQFVIGGRPGEMLRARGKGMSLTCAGGSRGQCSRHCPSGSSRRGTARPRRIAPCAPCTTHTPAAPAAW